MADNGLIILTGGAGFIGSCFLRTLNNNGITNIIVVDELDQTEKWKNLVGKKFYDYIDKDAFITMVKDNNVSYKPAYIVHLGACTSTTESDANYLLRNNYEYSKTLAQWAFKHNAFFMYASSAATYGDGSQGYDDNEATIPNLRPLNMYGYSKQLFDCWLLNNAREKRDNTFPWKYRVIGLKFFNVFGPNEYHKGDMRSVVCKKFDELQKDGCIRLFKSYHPDYKDGEQKRDFIYVKDVVEKMYQLYKTWSSPSLHRFGIYNVGSGHAYTWNDLAHAMFDALDKVPNIQYIDMPENLRNQYQYHTQATTQKLSFLDHSDPIDIKKDVKDYITNHLIKDGYERYW